VTAVCSWLSLVSVPTASAQQPASGRQPNIVMLWGDDVGWFNISANNNGMMGYKTPNIDRIARQGALFTDWYGQNSCTAGRGAFITGQVGFRTGLPNLATISETYMGSSADLIEDTFSSYPVAR